MESFFASLAICAGNSPVPGEFPAQRPVTRSFDVFVDVRLNKRLSKQSFGWWCETLPRPLWRQCNALAPRKFEWNFRHAIFRQILVSDGWGIPCEIALLWMSPDFTDDQSTLVQVMAWCRQGTSHYLSQYWPRSLRHMTPLGHKILKLDIVRHFFGSRQSI